MKARQVGSEIKGYDLRPSESSTLDPSYLKVSILNQIKPSGKFPVENLPEKYHQIIMTVIQANLSI